MWTTDDHTVAAGHSVTPASWQARLEELPGRVAHRFGRLEETFQAGKRLCGLDQHQVRRWRSWYRWVTLAMLAYAVLVLAAVTQHARYPPPLGLIPLTWPPSRCP
jgi:SRSO17 transposase